MDTACSLVGGGRRGPAPSTTPLLTRMSHVSRIRVFRSRICVFISCICVFLLTDAHTLTHAHRFSILNYADIKYRRRPRAGDRREREGGRERERHTHRLKLRGWRLRNSGWRSQFLNRPNNLGLAYGTLTCLVPAW